MATLPGGLFTALGGSTTPSVGHTAGDIINQVARYVGLSPVEDPYASTDPNFIQLCAFLTDQGQEILRKYEWSHLQNEYTFTTVQGQAAYDLPPDFRNMLDQTGWNRTTRLPLGGPLSPQEWQFLAGQTVGITFTVLFRPKQQQLYLYSGATIPAGNIIAFEYMSSWWVSPLGTATGTQAAPTKSTDTILFDPLLMTRALRVAFLNAKGFDSGAAQNDLDMAWELITSEDSFGPILSLNRRRETPLIGSMNLPFSGFGS